MKTAYLFARYLVAAYALFIWPNAVFAQENIAQGSLQTQVQRSLPQARLLGSARLNVWGFKVYDATLWVDNNFQPEDYTRSSFALNLAYLRDFTGQDIAKRSVQEMRGLGSVSDAQAAQWQAQMQQLFPNVRSGDQILGVYSPADGASFSLNGKPLGSLGEAEFARLFFGIWLSPKTSEPTMRRALLGLPKAAP